MEMGCVYVRRVITFKNRLIRVNEVNGRHSGTVERLLSLSCNYFSTIYVLLTVHPSIILVINQLNAKNLVL